MKTARSLVVCVLATAFGAAASAQEFVDIGTLKVRTDSPLAKGEYPRLAVTRAQLPAIRARLNDPEIRTYLRQAQDLVAANKASPLLFASLYQLTDEKHYADAAKKGLGQPSWESEWTFTFDMVAETMTDAERADWARKILEYVKGSRWRPRLLHCLAAWGNGVDDALTPCIEETHAAEVTRGLVYCNGWSRGRGGSPRGHGYNGQSFFGLYFSAMVGWSHATGDDVLPVCDFAQQQPVWYIYHYLPWQTRREVLRIGVISGEGHVSAVTPAFAEATSLVMLPITQTRNGLGQWWQREFIGNWPMPDWRRGQEHVYGLPGRLLWLDPSIPSIPPAKFPETRLFPESGHVLMRSDWTEDATVVLFKCGRQGKTDMRNNADNLHFIIWKGGHLAPDTGCVHWVNEAECDMLPQSIRTPARGANEHCYAKQTIAHNAITVGRSPIKQARWAWDSELLGNIVRGGQTILQEKDWLVEWGIEETPERPFKEGDITAYETSPRFDYVCGDATHSYPPARVKKITRQFVYLKPDTFVVFDRVQPRDPGLEVIWNFHALNAPAWNGRSAPDPAWTPERQFIITPEGKQVPNSHPGGHYLHTAGDTFRLTQGRGVLEATTLLPVEEDRIVRTIGGPWHDFEVNGVNCGPTEATYRQKRRESIGVGGWRIEVAPKAVSDEAQFLHVLHVGLAGEFKPAETALLRREGRVGASVVAGGRTFEVSFNATGPTGGHVKVIERDRTLADEDLVTEIEDNYDRWKDDPRYNEWMTDEFMRTVVFPYGKKP